MSCFKNIGYSTVKTVKIFDPLLATLHYSFMIAIFIYIAVIQVTQKVGYCEFADPIGMVRMSAQPPTMLGCDPDDPNCKFDYLPATALPYCTGYQGKAKAVTNKDCLYMGALEANFPVTGGSPFYISTRIRESNQTLVCRDPTKSNGDVCLQTYRYACNNSFSLPEEGADGCKANQNSGNCCTFFFIFLFFFIDFYSSFLTITIKYLVYLSFSFSFSFSFSSNNKKKYRGKRTFLLGTTNILCPSSRKIYVALRSCSKCKQWCFSSCC